MPLSVNMHIRNQISEKITIFIITSRGYVIITNNVMENCKNTDRDQTVKPTILFFTFLMFHSPFHFLPHKHIVKNGRFH
jgi:hypothetical protein